MMREHISAQFPWITACLQGMLAGKALHQADAFLDEVARIGEDDAATLRSTYVDPNRPLVRANRRAAAQLRATRKVEEMRASGATPSLRDVANTLVAEKDYEASDQSILPAAFAAANCS